MSEVTTNASGVDDSSQSENHSGGQNEGGGAANIEGLLKHKDKLLGENKKLKAEMADLRKLVESSNQEKMQAEGKKDELIAALKKEKDALNQKVVGTHSAFATRIISGELKAEAAKFGCVSLEDFVRLIDISQIEVDEDYNPDPAKVKELVQDAIKSRPFLFSKAAPNINTKLPNGETHGEQKDDLSKLTSKQILELAHKRARERK